MHLLRLDNYPSLGSSICARNSLVEGLIDNIAAFHQFGRKTVQTTTRVELQRGSLDVPTFINEFWTSQQRQSNPLHEISHRACFKPELPRFFIERLTKPGDLVFDPFMGRGTTVIEAALLRRSAGGSDANPLCAMLTRPRLKPPTVEQIAERLKEIPLNNCVELPSKLLTFYHPETLKEISSLKKYFADRASDQSKDYVDEWIEMVALNRLTGYSPGFFSVYTLPPNQSVTVAAQQRINAKRAQTPPRRHVAPIILKKSSALLSGCCHSTRATLQKSANPQCVTTGSASALAVPPNSVDLVVSSPPFLDVVDYKTDNWLRCWFADIDPDSVQLTTPRRSGEWQAEMKKVFAELYRVLLPGGHLAFEVGEVRGGKLKMEHLVIPVAVAAGFQPLLILINDQKFTKTANCWRVDNNVKGTNTNRVVVLIKPH